MSIFWIVLVVIAIGVTLAAFSAALVLFSPIILIMDSQNRELRVRWLVLFEYWRPFPGAGTEGRLSVAGRPIRLRRGRRKIEAPAKPSTAQTPIARRTRGALLRRAIGNSTIRRALAKQIAILFRGLFRSFTLARCRTEVSLADPASNGMLTGLLAHSARARRIGRKLGVQINFRGENSLIAEVRLHPHRIVKACFFFFSGLPYRALFREWRALAPLRAVE